MLSARVPELLPSFHLEFFAEKKSFKWKNQLSLFCRNVRDKFSDIWKKTQSSSEKVYWELRNMLSLLPKRMLEKKEFFCGKKSASMKISDLSKKFKFSVRTFFQQFFRTTMPDFRRIFRGYFFWKRKTFFLFVLPSNSLIWWENCSIAVKCSF